MNWMIFLLLVLLLASCDASKEMKNLLPGTCINETNKKYVSTSKGSQTIYKVNRANGDTYSVSNFKRGTWIFLSEKRRDYFIENNNFNYSIVQCPDKKKEESDSLKDRVKSIQFKRK
jgi:hypothetical protein